MKLLIQLCCMLGVLAVTGYSEDLLEENTPLIHTLRAKIASEEANLSGLLGRYRDKHPIIQESRSRLAVLKLALERRERRQLADPVEKKIIERDSVARQLARIDLDLSIHHYRDIRAEYLKTNLRRKLLRTEILDESARKLEADRLELRLRFLEDALSETRQLIETLHSELNATNSPGGKQSAFE